MPTSPSSPTNTTTELERLRADLLDVNLALLASFRTRSALVKAVQNSKPAGTGPWKAFDLERERRLFSLMRAELDGLGEREWLALSLLMEEHAGAPSDYPAWSAGVHLEELPLANHHRLNPVLLEVMRPDWFAGLRLRPSFAFLRPS